MTWVDRTAGEDPDSFEEQRKAMQGYFRSSRSNILADHVIEEVDPEVVKHSIFNFFNAAYSYWPKNRRR